VVQSEELVEECGEKIPQIGETKLFMAREEEASIREKEDQVAEKGERKVQPGSMRAETREGRGVVYHEKKR
jgi:hypothetical protein